LAKTSVSSWENRSRSTSARLLDRPTYRFPLPPLPARQDLCPSALATVWEHLPPLSEACRLAAESIKRRVVPNQARATRLRGLHSNIRLRISLIDRDKELTETKSNKTVLHLPDQPVTLIFRLRQSGGHTFCVGRENEAGRAADATAWVRSAVVVLTVRSAGTHLLEDNWSILPK
jgi:hypothetical protein